MTLNTIIRNIAWMRCFGLHPLRYSYLKHVFEQIASAPECVGQEIMDDIYQSQPKMITKFLGELATKEPEEMSKTETEFLNLINEAE